MILSGKIPVLAAWLLIAAVLLGGCQFGREENDFVFDLDAAPINLDPQSADDTASRQVIANLFEGLVSVGDDGVPEPAAAESWEVSDDELCYTFTLREDAKWEDGSPVTAKDFVFGFQRLLDPDTNAPAAEDFYAIRNAEAVHRGELEPEELGVRALSEYVLEIELTEADPYFFEKLDTAAAMPCHAEFFAGTKGRYGLSKKNIMGNGAFYLSTWAENGNLTFRPNRHYHSASEVTATSVLYVVPKEERASTVSRFQDGTVSAAHFTGSEYQLLTDPECFTVQENDSAVWGMVFNVDKEPFSSDALREAMFLTADFSAMEQVLPEYLERITAVIPSSVEIDGKPYRSMVGNLKFPTPDSEAAQQAYNRALSEIEPESLRGARMILPEGENHAEYFAYLSQIWQRDLGLYITVEVLPQAEYEARLASGDFECALYRLAGSGNDPCSMLLPLSNGSFRCPDSGYGELLGQAAQMEGQELADTCFQAEQLLLDRCSFLPFYRQTEYFVLNDGISGITYHFSTGIPDFRFGKVQ